MLILTYSLRQQPWECSTLSKADVTRGTVYVAGSYNIRTLLMGSLITREVMGGGGETHS